MTGILSITGKPLMAPELDDYTWINNEILQVKKSGRLGYWKLSDQSWLWEEPTPQK
jgi:hypothetical protein